MKKLFNLINKDIKGPNIMVDKNGVCKLTDFGSAIKIYRNNNEMGKDLQVNGTANWMAPEVIKQEGYGRYLLHIYIYITYMYIY